MCLHLDGECLLFALQELWPIGLWKQRLKKRQRVSELLLCFFSFAPALLLPPPLLSLKLHIIWSGTSLRESLTKPLHGASGQNLLQFMFSPSALPLPAFCFPGVHPISQTKLNLVCSVSNSLFLSLFSFSLAALLPCPSSALQLQVVLCCSRTAALFGLTFILPCFWPSTLVADR